VSWWRPTTRTRWRLGATRRRRWICSRHRATGHGHTKRWAPCLLAARTVAKRITRRVPVVRPGHHRIRTHCPKLRTQAAHAGPALAAATAARHAQLLARQGDAAAAAAVLAAHGTGAEPVLLAVCWEVAPAVLGAGLDARDAQAEQQMRCAGLICCWGCSDSVGQSSNPIELQFYPRVHSPLSSWEPHHCGAQVCPASRAAAAGPAIGLARSTHRRRRGLPPVLGSAPGRVLRTRRGGRAAGARGAAGHGCAAICWADPRRQVCACVHGSVLALFCGAGHFLA
jgi:hypothetical protein